MSIPAYDLMEVRIGDQIIAARPIQWSGQIVDDDGNDAFGQLILVVAYATTCPHCGQLIQFGPDDLYIATDGTINNIGCASCGKANDRSEDDNAIIIIEEEEEEKSNPEYKEKLVQPRRLAPSQIFTDPILSGEFDLPVDIDELNELSMG